jgi:hypothetical protein
MGVKGLGLTGESYAIEKAIEDFIGEAEQNYMSFDMQRGIDLEPLAFDLFKNQKSLQFIETEQCGFIEFNNITGSSPDGLVSDNSVLEIKCPTHNTFFKLVATNEVDQKYFYQMQHQMMCTGKEKAYFFNYYVLDGEEYHHEIIVERDEDVIKKMITRIAEANIIKLEYLKQLKNNKQWK